MDYGNGWSEGGLSETLPQCRFCECRAPNILSGQQCLPPMENVGNMGGGGSSGGIGFQCQGLDSNCLAPLKCHMLDDGKEVNTCQVD